MKKTIIAAALLSVMGGAQAATTHDFVGGFDMYAKGAAAGATPTFTDTTVTGAFDMVNATGSFTTTTPFFGALWTADTYDMFMYDSVAGGIQDFTFNFDYSVGTFADGTAGTTNCTVTANFDGCTGYMGITYNTQSLSYDFQLTNAGQFAAGVIFDWDTSNDIPVLAVLQVTNDPMADGGVMNVVSVDSDGDGNPGTAMLVGAFPGQTPAFSGTMTPVSAVPVPAAVWLFGSGLVGLAGIARRRKTA